MNQKDLVDLSRDLISMFSAKISDAMAPQRAAYINFLTKEYEISSPESVKKKNSMLSALRKDNRRLQKGLESIITHLSNMMSSQTSSKRTHDLKRLERQAAIQSNVEAVKFMTFDALAGKSKFLGVCSYGIA
jgi:hypothetical protein